MIRIALVEDEAEVRAQLQGYVQRHTRQLSMRPFIIIAQSFDSQ